MSNQVRALTSRLATALLASTALCAAANAADQKLAVTFYGFLMGDAIYDTERVDPAWQDAFRPSKIDVFGGTFGGDGQASISAKQSRFGVKGTVPVADDVNPIEFKFEFDMFGVGVDEGQTTIRLRHAYGQWGQFLVGQTHTLFMDIDVFPNVIDYWGPSGMVFFRTPQVRWTPWKDADSWFAVAIERPGNDVDPGQIREVDPSLGSSIQSDEEIFDLTAQFNTHGDWGHFQVAAILRRLGFETLGTPDSQPSGSETGWGFDISGHANVLEKDKLYGSVVFGEGIANYMNDGGTDLAAGGTLEFPKAEAVPLLGILAYWDHYWCPEWSSTIGYSLTQVDNTSLQTFDAFHRGEYASVNLIWTPDPNLLFGGEVMWGQRENNNGETGDDVRLQFSAKYSWGITVTP